MRGEGQYRRRLPAAIQRACFGGNAIQKAKGVLRSSASLRVLSDYFAASHSHIRKLRGCVAAHVLMLQHALLADLPMMRHVVWVAFFDETDMDLCAEQAAGTSSRGNVRRHVLMVHFVIAARYVSTMPLRWKECISAPAVLKNQKATTILRALSKRAPISVMNLAAKCRRLAVIPATDAANTCKSVGYHYAGKVMQMRRDIL